MLGADLCDPGTSTEYKVGLNFGFWDLTMLVLKLCLWKNRIKN